MPYRGDSAIEAWDYWFDAPPSETVGASLEWLVREHSAGVVIEAIAITGGKTAITTETARLSYVKGILHRKVLAVVAPERAEVERQIDTIQAFWSKLGLYSWPLNRKKIASWLSVCTVTEISAVMRVSRNWTDFREQMEKIIESRQAPKTETD